MRTVVLKAYTGPNRQTHPDETFNASADVNFLASDDYVPNSQLENNFVPVVLGQVTTSYERWLKVLWDNDDNTIIQNLRVYFSGQLPPGVYLRVGTSATYATPSNEMRSYTGQRTYNFGGPTDIIEGDETTYLFVPVVVRPDGRVESDYIVVQLVVDGDRLPTYDLVGNVDLQIDYDETSLVGG